MYDLKAYGFDGWIVASLGLLAVAAAVVAGGPGGQAPKRARRLAAHLAEEGDQRAPVADALNWTAAAAVVAILALMVWKPPGA